ncbi:MAG: DUF3298 and DUF4163 domain-containing protein [Firmicutes bacterium]|nr:DUF3298 and DUF4163 domain-containing protein [Bacillota bacterium]
MQTKIRFFVLSVILLFTVQACMAGEKTLWKVNRAKLTEKTSSYKVDITYPEITGLSDAKTAKYCNDVLKKYAQDSVVDFKKEMNSLIKEGLKSHAGYDVVIKFTSSGTARYASFNFEGGRFLGGAHPEPLNKTFVFDLKNSKVVSFSSLFNPKSDYLKKISSYCISDLNKQEPDMADFAKTGAAPDLNNYKWFVVTDSKLVVIFPSCTAGPYAAGTREVKIPFSVLSKMGIVNTSGILGEVVK